MAITYKVLNFDPWRDGIRVGMLLWIYDIQVVNSWISDSIIAIKILQILNLV